MPIGIFLFTRKSDYQKSEKTGKKRRKPEKISVFSVGIFFVKTHWRRHPEFRYATGTSNLPNRILPPQAAEPGPTGVTRKIKRTPFSVLFIFGGATRNRTGDRGVADLCLTAWPWRRSFERKYYITIP